jgi:hypothetical protein
VPFFDYMEKAQENGKLDIEVKNLVITGASILGCRREWCCRIVDNH